MTDEESELRKSWGLEIEKSKNLAIKTEKLKAALKIAIDEIHLEFCSGEHHPLCEELTKVLNEEPKS